MAHSYAAMKRNGEQLTLVYTTVSLGPGLVPFSLSLFLSFSFSLFLPRSVGGCPCQIQSDVMNESTWNNVCLHIAEAWSF